MKVKTTPEKTIINGTQKELAKEMKARFNLSESDFNKHCASARKLDHVWDDFIPYGINSVIVYLVKGEMFLGIRNI